MSGDRKRILSNVLDRTEPIKQTKQMIYDKNRVPKQIIRRTILKNSQFYANVRYHYKTSFWIGPPKRWNERQGISIFGLRDEPLINLTILD